MSTPPQAAPGYGSFAPPALGMPPPPPPAVRASRGRRVLWGAVWGFTGAVFTSAVWTVALCAVPSMVSTASSPLPAGGYRTSEDLCEAVRLDSFSRLYPVHTGTPYHYTTRHHALDDMYCGQSLKRSSGEGAYVSVNLEAQLHRTVSAAPEFDAQRAGFEQRGYQVEVVADLGDQAFAAFLDDQSGADHSWHYLTQSLYVQEGALTCCLHWSGSYQEGKGGAPDREEIRQALLADVRDAMHALRERQY